MGKALMHRKKTVLNPLDSTEWSTKVVLCTTLLWGWGWGWGGGGGGICVQGRPCYGVHVHVHMPSNILGVRSSSFRKNKYCSYIQAVVDRSAVCTAESRVPDTEAVSRKQSRAL